MRPARLTQRFNEWEAMAQVGLQSENPDVVAQAYLTLGDAMLENGNREEAKGAYLKAVLLGSPKALRYCAQRLWDIGEQEESIRQAFAAVG